MGKPAATSLRIVLIEDSADTAELLSMLLERCGHTVQLAADGAAGLQLISSCDPDVVLSDITLPGEIDGYGVAQALLRTGHGGARRPFIVALSGHARDSDKTRAREAGFDAHFSKPVDPQALIALLSTLKQAV